MLFRSKYKLIEWQSKDLGSVKAWIEDTPALLSAASHLNMTIEEMSQWLPKALVKSGAATITDDHLINLD